jgi:hypothetical protein
MGIESSYLLPANVASGESVTALAFNLHAQYVDAHLGVGGYAQLPLSYVDDSQGGQSNSNSGVGDIELGGIYAPPTGGSPVSIILRAGLVLPTGSTGMGGAANIVGALSRLTDFYLAIPGGLSGRLSGHVLVRQGAFFARADLGIDANKSANMNADFDSILHANGGVGYEAGQVAVMAESVNMFVFGNSNTDFGSSWINEGAVSARYRAGKVEPYLAVIFPLDHDSNQIINAVVTVGVDGVLAH